MAFQKYEGSDKYHFRYYRKSVNHPFLVVLVASVEEEDGKFLLTGFSLTHSAEVVLKRPSRFIRFKTNPNPDDSDPSFLCVNVVSDAKSKYFSEPLKKWHLCEEDEKAIDEIVERMLTKKK